MAQIFATPTELVEPPDLGSYFRKEGGLDLEGLRKAEFEWLKKLEKWCKETTDSNSDLVGQSIFIPWADGAAQYMVWRTKPLSLIHVPLRDAWHVPDYMTRGLRVSDIRNMVQREQRLREIFGQKG